VKSVFLEGIPNSWGRSKLTEIFKKYGKVEHVVLSCDMRSPITTDIAYIHYTTCEAAMLCVESFDGQELAENDSKVSSHNCVKLKFLVNRVFTFLVVHAR
jgi:RNA recognition motif-containing protein